MSANWLFQIPEAPTLDDQIEILEARLEADPGARAISAEEAETFLASAHALVFVHPNMLATWAKLFGMRGNVTNEGFKRHLILVILKSWREPRTKEVLLVMRSGIYHRDLGAAHDKFARLEISDLVGAYYRQHNLIWLTHLLRLTNRAEQIPSFLDRLDEFAREIYPFYLNVGRLMIRRIVDRVGSTTERPGVKNPGTNLKAKLREQVRGAFQTKRELERQKQANARQERWRKAKEVTLEAYVESIRQEVAAAEARLVETESRQVDEESALRERHRRRLTELATEGAEEEAAFARALTAQTAALPLADLRIALRGPWSTAERAVIESAGGQLVQERPDLTLVLGAHGEDRPASGQFCTMETGAAALERLLHRRILPQITRFRPT
jgi:hypothetical protein